MTLQDLIAQKEAADAALREAEEGLLAELVAAKEAFRADPSPENLARKEAAVDAIRAYRGVVRAERGARHQVAGDAFVDGGN